MARSGVEAGRATKLVAIARVRRGAKPAYLDERLTVAIREVLASTPLMGAAYRTVWAKVRIRGIRTSKPRVMRLLSRVAH